MLAALFLLAGYDPREENAMKASIPFVVDLQSLLIFDDRGEVDWIAGVPLAVSSAFGPYSAAQTRPRSESTASL